MFVLIIPIDLQSVKTERIYFSDKFLIFFVPFYII